LIYNIYFLLSLMLPIRSYEPKEIASYSKKGRNTHKIWSNLNENYTMRFSISENNTLDFSNSYLKKNEELCVVCLFIFTKRWSYRTNGPKISDEGLFELWSIYIVFSSFLMVELVIFLFVIQQYLLESILRIIAI